MKVGIREATMGDYDVVKELLDYGASMHHEGEPGIIGDPSERHISRGYISRLLEDESSGLLVAEVDNGDDGVESEQRVAGVMHLVFQDTEDQPGLTARRYVLVVDVEVKEEFRGRGIGQELMKAAEEWARGKGASQLELSVWQFNDRARVLYERLGYRTIYRQMLKEI